MEDSEINNDATCLLCCQERDFFILPKCNHKHICWRCCINMVKEGNFGCPFCKTSVNEREKIIFVTLEHMKKYSYNEILKTKEIQLLKSEKNSNYFYSNQQVAEKIEYQTSYNCPFEECDQLFDNLNQLKKHLDQKHKRQYCDICINNRKCIHSQQILYTESQYQRHIKNGQFSENGDLILFHPTCTFCKQTFYDIDQFKRHLQRTHQKCFICHKNSEELKYVYYQNYQQAVQHFKKSHHYCEIGTCMGTKFQNVFVTQQALNQHVLRVHKKSVKKNQPIVNIMLGFNKIEQQSVFQWDKIGKNFSAIFHMVQKNTSSVNLKPVQHEDLKIDVRDFYPEQSKISINLSLPKIKEKIEDKLYQLKYKQSDLFIDDVVFFKPLQMQPLTRVDLERFLGGIFDKKICDPIVNKFFAGRQDFSSADQYFGFVRDKMRSYSKIAYYFAFPQLIRFFKNDNPHKTAMDEFYYETLRDLKVKRPFIIHTKEKYSEILFFMKELIQSQIEQRDQDSNKMKKELDVEKYISFLKDNSLAYYVKHQEDIFYVSKEKITNLYHMINKCKVQDFLKMNWLLKIGFSNDAYKIIWKQFYYREEKQCYHAIKKLNIQELAYLYAYCTICLESIFEKDTFMKNKKKPSPLFMSEILSRIKRSSTHQKISEITELQRKFLNSDHHVNYNKDKGVIINLEDHPSLLDRNIDVGPSKSKPPDKKQDFPTIAGFGTIRPKLWNQQTNSNINQKSKKMIEEYPTILSNPTKKQQEKVKEEEFPVFHYVGKKNKKQKVLNKTMNLHQAIGWGGSGLISNKWNEQQSLKSWKKREEDEKNRIKRHQEIQKEIKFEKKIEQKHFLQPNKQDAIKKQQKQKTYKKQQKLITNIEQKPIKQEPMMFIMSKKAQKIDQDDNLQPTKKKNKNKKKNQPNQNAKEQQISPKKKKQEECGLFEQIQKESQIVSKKQKKQEEKPVVIEPVKKQQKKPITQINNFTSSKNNYVDISNADFPALSIPENSSKKVSNPPPNVQKQASTQSKPQEQPRKKRKMRADDTSSDQEKYKKKQHKKSEEFASISQKFGNGKGEEKISMVNQIIQSAKVEQKPENIIQVKKNKKGKKEIIERVNLQNLW